MHKDAITEELTKNITNYYKNLLKTAEKSFSANMVAGNGVSNLSSIGTITAPNTGGQYGVPIVYPTPGGPAGAGMGGITPNNWSYKTWMDPNATGLVQFPAGLVHDRVEEYLNKRGHETMRGRFEHDFLINVLGLVPEEMKDRWFILKDKEEMTDDPTVCSNVKGKAVPLLHKCKEGGKYYSKTETNMTGDQIWCAHCEEDLPEDLETMLVISHVM